MKFEIWENYHGDFTEIGRLGELWEVNFTSDLGFAETGQLNPSVCPRPFVVICHTPEATGGEMLMWCGYYRCHGVSMEKFAAPDTERISAPIGTPRLADRGHPPPSGQP